MDHQVEIPVETLRRAAAILLDRLEAAEGSIVAIENDMFWVIAAEQRSNLYAEPTDFTVGQVTECLENLDRIVDNPSIATSYALVWLADVLRAAGETVVK